MCECVRSPLTPPDKITSNPRGLSQLYGPLQGLLQLVSPVCDGHPYCLAPTCRDKPRPLTDVPQISGSEDSF